MKNIGAYLEAYTSEWYLPDIRVTDIIEIMITATPFKSMDAFKRRSSSPYFHSGSLCV